MRGLVSLWADYDGFDAALGGYAGNEVTERVGRGHAGIGHDLPDLANRVIHRRHEPSEVGRTHRCAA